MLRTIASLWQSRGLTVFLSLVVIIVVAKFHVESRLEARAEEHLALLARSGERTRLEDFNPPRVSWQNAAPYYLAAIETCRQGPPLGYTDSVEDNLRVHRDLVRQSLAERGAAFTLLEEAYRRPECAFDYDMRKGYRMLVPHYLALRSLSLLAALCVRTAAEDGEAARAVATSAHMLRLLNRFRYGDTLIHHAILTACDQRTLEPLEWLAGRGFRADYAAVLEELRARRRYYDVGLLRTVEAERAMAVDLCKRLAEGDDRDVLAEVGSIPGEDTPLTWTLYRAGGRTMVLADQLYLLDRYDEIVRAVRQDRPDLLPGENLAKWACITRIVLPNYRRQMERTHEVKTRLDAVIRRLEALRR